MVMPAAATIFEMSGRQLACSPISKNVPLTHMSVSALITAGVFSGHGPSSKVSTTSLSRRKSYCLKCSVPNAGPPVVSISTMRESPSAFGLLHGGMLFFTGALAALAAAAVGAGALAGIAAAVAFCAISVGAADAAGALSCGADGVSEIWVTGDATGRAAATLLAAGGVAGASVLCAGEMTRAASATSEVEPAAFCAATTPNAARPKVTNAAMTTTTTRIVPSATILTEACPK